MQKLAEETTKQFKDRKNQHKEKFIAKYNSSKPTVYSISKGKLSRRFLHIPNPKHFSLLSEKIVSRWSDFETVFKLSSYSHSFPLPNQPSNKRSINTFSKTVSDFRNALLETSIDKLIEVRVDISKFYPSIYTHSITWALLGKEEAKKYFSKKENLDSLISTGDAKAELYKYAESLDIALRACQERQSIGIPIGPDTSYILAEIIACRIDSILEKRLNNINLKACRFYDDYYLYVSSKGDADKTLRCVQQILSEFQLEINESKIKIREFPFAFEDEFTTTLHNFQFKQTNQSNSIKLYFSLIWSFAENNPHRMDWIFRYSLKMFENLTCIIQKNSWKVFENLLIKTALIEPAILNIVTKIFLTYNSYIDVDSKQKLKELVNTIIKVHCGNQHNFEISWALWIAKTFKIEIKVESANSILKMKDNISNLILLDIFKNSNLIEGNPNLSVIESELKDEVLMTENWLIAYEAVKKGWLVPAETNLLENNLFFKILKDKNIEFYNSSKQLETFQLSVKETKIPSVVANQSQEVNEENKIEPKKINQIRIPISMEGYGLEL